jgi:hypothetical protein
MVLPMQRVEAEGWSEKEIDLVVACGCVAGAALLRSLRSSVTSARFAGAPQVMSPGHLR